MAPPLVPLSPLDIVAGVPLACDIYSEEGRLLLRSGGVVYAEDHVLALRSSARKRSRPVAALVAPRPLSSHAMMEALSHRLEALFDLIARNPDSPGFVGALVRVASTLVHACDQDADAAFAYPHLDTESSYPVYHAVMAAVVCAVLARARGLPDERRLSLVCAALTHDLSLRTESLGLDARMELDPWDRQRILEHPDATAALLKRLNVDDPDWIAAVASHHERINGSGYPRGLSGEDLSVDVRIMSIADALSAMLRPRPYRSRHLAKDALASLYQNAAGDFDQELLSMLVRALGIYPAGTVVGLRCGHLAVVRRRGDRGASKPVLWKVIDGKGMVIAQPVPCHAGEDGIEIVSLHEPTAIRAARRVIDRGW